LNLVTLALRNLQRRAARSAIVSVSVGLAVASALSLVALARSIETSASEGAYERGSDLVVMSRNASDFFDSSIAEDLKNSLASIKDVVSADGELILFAPVNDARQRLVVGSAVDSQFWKKMPLSAGRTPKPDEPKAVVLGQESARILNTRVGEKVNILDDSLTVVGIANYQSTLNRSMIFTLLPELQNISFHPKRVTMFQIKINPSASHKRIEAIKDEITRLGSISVAPTDQLMQRDRNLLVMKAISNAVSLIALALGALSVLNALLMAVQERTREIGIMMAIGWSRARTMASIFLEGLAIGIAGCVLGLPASFGISYLFKYLPTVGEILTFRPTFTIVAPTLLASIALCGIGALYPAWRASSMKPADALRRL
jgi:putative ABC transport system permease protein